MNDQNNRPEHTPDYAPNTGQAQEPKRNWGEEESHGNNADWGKEGSEVERKPDQNWGETSQGDTPPPGTGSGNEPVQPGKASNQGQGSDISREAEGQDSNDQ